MYSIRIPRAHLFAKVSFVLFIFFAIFTTSIPFQNTLQEAGEVTTTNMISVLLYPTLFILSLVAFIPKAKEIILIIKKEKMLSILLIWALFSITWSQYPSVSFKRWFQIFCYMFVTVVYFSYCDSIKSVIKTIKPVVYLYLALSIIVVFIIPAATDPRFGSWRGLTSHKNQLGSYAYLLAIFLSIVLISESSLLKKSIALGFLFISVVLLIGASSSTSFIAFAIFFVGSILFYFQASVFNTIGVGKFLAVISFFALILIFYAFYTMAPEIIDSLNMTGKDVQTMSDRSYLWEYMFLEIAKHPILGCGFRGFWVVGSVGIDSIHMIFPFMPIQSHNGYLDIMNEMGVVGLTLFALVIFNYVKEVRKIGDQGMWVWYVLLPLVVNITETTLFREGSSAHIFFTISYLIPFSFRNKNMY